MFIIASVFYVLIAAAMIVLILIQRGSGANAGSGFGGGASATVFGARGSTTFLSRATGVLAGLFFLLSLGMGMWLGHTGAPQPASSDLGVMSGVVAPAAGDAKPGANAQQPANAQPARTDVPQPAAPAAGDAVPKAATPAGSDVPAATDSKATPAATTPADGKQGSQQPAKE
jgi:preprotein translocase subunit SecG